MCQNKIVFNRDGQEIIFTGGPGNTAGEPDKGEIKG